MEYLFVVSDDESCIIGMMANSEKTLTEKQTKRLLSVIVFAQCFGMSGTLIFQNGFLLNYLSRLDISSAGILLLLGVPSLIQFLTNIPFAFLSDNLGKKKMGALGLSGTALGFFLIFSGAFTGDRLVVLVTVLGIGVFSLGQSMFSSSWFALLSPIVPEQIRGRFFGRLRFSWQTVGIVLTFIITAILKSQTDLKVYQYAILIIATFLLVRVFLYLKIPELEKNTASGTPFLPAIMKVARLPNYFPFCAYVFLLTLFTGSCPWVLGLLEKDVLSFSEDQIVLMGNLLAMGAVIGYFLGGKMVDRWGTKPVFLFCHLSYGIILFLVVMRDFIPLPVIVTIGCLTMFYGVTFASSTISVTSELLGMLPKENKALTAAFCSTMWQAGIALSAILFGRVIKLSILNESWVFFNKQVSNYDALLLGSSIMITLLVVTLGLIPSVIRKAQWYPH